ncbi:hypothetical protein [Actinomadura sp. NBRC 104425]|nr:hypothetical protein [Actinomadura sp. NBRC 104425]
MASLVVWAAAPVPQVGVTDAAVVDPPLVGLAVLGWLGGMAVRGVAVV